MFFIKFFYVSCLSYLLFHLAEEALEVLTGKPGKGAPAKQPAHEEQQFILRLHCLAYPRGVKVVNGVRLLRHFKLFRRVVLGRKAVARQKRQRVIAVGKLLKAVVQLHTVVAL